MKKNLKLVIIALLIQFPVILIILISISADNGRDITLLIPINNGFFDMIYFFVLSPLLMIFFIQFCSIGLSRALFKLHNVIKLNKCNYAIIGNVKENLNFAGIILRALVLGFFALSIGMIMVQFINPEIIISRGDIELLGLIIISTFFILPFLILILAPIWLLQDCGIMSSRNEERIRKESRKLPNIEGVHRIYSSYVMGYVGITTIVSLIIIMYSSMFSEFSYSKTLFFPLGFIAPFFSVAISIIPILFYERKLPKLRKKLIIKLTMKEINIINDIKEL